jgi:hypothetical protein
LDAINVPFGSALGASLFAAASRRIIRSTSFKGE